jgi:hypothetical protein
MIILLFQCKDMVFHHTLKEENARPCIRFERNRIQGFLFYDDLDKRRENDSERNSLTVMGGTTNLELKLRL